MRTPRPAVPDFAWSSAEAAERGSTNNGARDDGFIHWWLCKCHKRQTQVIGTETKLVSK